MCTQRCRFAEPLTLACGLVLRNRIIRAAAFAGGTLAEQTATHAEVAAGGVALTTVAYTAVAADGRTFASQLLLTPGAAPAELADVARAVHSHGALLSFQLTHAGSFADMSVPGSGSGKAIAPSAVFELATLSRPRPATPEDMDRITEQFSAAARVAVGPGEADAVEVHLGHGYLLSQWLCPFTNRRTDEHGGSVENRARFPLRVVRAVRAAVGPRKAVFVKLNVSDGFSGGVSPPDVAALVAALIAEPGLVDGIIPSAGFVSRNGFYMLRGDVPRAGMVSVGGCFALVTDLCVRTLY
jgi:2,4-dienoyl-CoA reductase-like NADH-dependent reductase (Old Yellow Enzyme family)